MKIRLFSLKSFAQSWLFLFTLAGLLSFFFKDAIQAHHLDQSLAFGYDPYGRNCFFLSLNASIQSLIQIAPLGLACLVLSFVLSSLVMIKNDWFQFSWNALWETLTSLPGFMVAITLSAFFPVSYFIFFIAALFLLIPYLIRFFEGQIQSILTQDYVAQAVSMGASSSHIYRAHVIPELFYAMRSILPFILSRLLIIESSLTFVGIKQPSPVSTWGELLYMGKDYLLEAPWISLITALPLFLTLFSFHLISKAEPS